MYVACSYSFTFSISHYLTACRNIILGLIIRLKFLCERKWVFLSRTTLRRELRSIFEHEICPITSSLSSLKWGRWKIKTWVKLSHSRQMWYFSLPPHKFWNVKILPKTCFWQKVFCGWKTRCYIKFNVRKYIHSILGVCLIIFLYVLSCICTYINAFP